MFLITEVNFDNVKAVKEINEGNEKKYYLKGIFLQAEQKNRNGRIYPAHILEREVNRFNKDYVEQNRALGELSHPKNPLITPERACHLIKELKRDGNNWIGKSLITSTPIGNIVKGLLEDGVSLGVSSRGLGTLREDGGVKYVNSDYYLSTIDVVTEPSAPDAWVDGIYENREWVMENGVFIEKAKKIIDKHSRSKTSKADNVLFLSLFEEYLKSL